MPQGKRNAHRRLGVQSGQRVNGKGRKKKSVEVIYGPELRKQLPTGTINNCLRVTATTSLFQQSPYLHTINDFKI
jgi:hypothetical protein